MTFDAIMKAEMNRRPDDPRAWVTILTLSSHYIELLTWECQINKESPVGPINKPARTQTLLGFVDIELLDCTWVLFESSGIKSESQKVCYLAFNRIAT